MAQALGFTAIRAGYEVSGPNCTFIIEEATVDPNWPAHIHPMGQGNAVYLALPGSFIPNPPGPSRTRPSGTCSSSSPPITRTAPASRHPATSSPSRPLTSRPRTRTRTRTRTSAPEPPAAIPAGRNQPLPSTSPDPGPGAGPGRTPRMPGALST